MLLSLMALCDAMSEEGLLCNKTCRGYHSVAMGSMCMKEKMAPEKLGDPFQCLSMTPSGI